MRKFSWSSHLDLTPGPDNRIVLVDDPALPAAVHLTGPHGRDVVDAAVTQLGGRLEGLAVKGIQYRPDHDLVVQFRADVAWAGDPQARRDTLLAGVSSQGVMPGTLPVTATVDGDELTVSLWRWPFDPYVPGVAAAATPGMLTDLIGASVGADATREVVAYRPTERAVVRATSKDGSVTIYIKAVPPSDVATLVGHHGRLIDAGLPAPVVLAADVDSGVVVLEEMKGMTLRERIKGGMDTLIRPGELASLIDSLRRVDPSGLPHLSGRVSDALWHGRLLSRVAPASRDRLDTLAPVFEEASQAARSRIGTTVHGDLHEGQLIVDDSGSITGLLDVDSLAAGDPLDDVITLLGHLTYRVMRGDDSAHLATLIDTLRHDGADRFGSELVDLGTAAVLVGLATGPFRTQNPGWESETERILAAATDLAGAT